MHKKRFWFILGAVALLMPSIVICVLLCSSDGITLDDFADSSRFTLVSEDGKATELADGDEGYRLLQVFLEIADDVGVPIKEEEVSSWLYTVQIPNEDCEARIGISEGKAVFLWDGRASVLDYPFLTSNGRELFPSLIRYGVKTEEGYLDAPLLEQNRALVYSVSSAEDLSFIQCCEDDCEVKTEVLLYRHGEESPTASFESLELVSFDPSATWSIFINLECVMDGYRVQCSYEFDYRPTAD